MKSLEKFSGSRKLAALRLMWNMFGASCARLTHYITHAIPIKLVQHQISLIKCHHVLKTTYKSPLPLHFAPNWFTYFCLQLPRFLLSLTYVVYSESIVWSCSALSPFLQNVYIYIPILYKLLNGGWFWDLGHPSGETVVKFFINSNGETKWIGRFFFEIYLKINSRAVCRQCKMLGNYGHDTWFMNWSQGRAFRIGR